MTSIEKRFLTAGDLILVGALLIGSVVLVSGVARKPGNPGGTGNPVQYRVFVTGHPERKLHFPKPPKEPARIEGLLGPTIIEWDERGHVRIASSPCPNRICMSQGWVEAPFGVCCAPNGVVVECVQLEQPFDGEAR